MGDFNATPWSRPFRRVLTRSGMCDSRTGFGMEASFPAAAALVRIPIDHVLASCSIGVRDRHIERDVGSAHLPVVIDLVVPRPRSEPGRRPSGLIGKTRRLFVRMRPEPGLIQPGLEQRTYGGHHPVVAKPYP